MKTALLLLLGGFLCGLHGAEGQDPDLLIIITKLLTRVQTLETEVQSHQSQVQALQSEIQSLKNHTQNLETKDQPHQSQVQAHQSEVQSLKTQIQDLETKDQSHQSQLQSLQSEVQALKTQDQSLQTEVQSLKTQEQSLQTEVQSLKTQIQTLEISETQLQTNPRVAFYAGFNTGTEEGEYGPFDVWTTIKYKKVLTNVGGGYSADTGKFTAPLNGTYVFSFVTFTRNNTFVSLMKNSEILAYGYDKSVSDQRDSSTAVAVVTLEAGDTAYVQLEPQGRFFAFRGFLNSFSGFLLFPIVSP